MREYYHLHQDKFLVPLALEKGFTLRVGPYSLMGRVDRIDCLPDNSLEIVDYKTGSVPKDLTKINKWNKAQLLIYQMALGKLFNKPISKVTFYYLDENKSISFLGSQDDLQKLQADIISMIEKIKKSDFVATPNKFVCQYCDYKGICEDRET